MAPQLHQRWSAGSWLRDWVNRDRREGWREGNCQLPLPSWRSWIDYEHCIWLVFLGFWFLTPYLDHQPLRYWFLLFLALALFIPFYLLAHFGPPRARRFWVAAMFLLGMVYVPINPSAWGIYIYIAASLPELSESSNTVISLLLLQCAAVLMQSWLFHLSAWTWSMGLGFTMLVGMNRLRMEQKNRADAKLRMAHEEIEQLAKTAERERIARDMHDILGHSLSLIVLKSELAGRLLASQPARAGLEIAEIETTARQALAEVRKTITGYRCEGFASELIRAAQVLETAGVRLNKPAKAPYLTPRHEATLSLVLREAVTNIVRHAGASECSIEVSTAQDRTQLVIADDGRGDIHQEGNGLRGMRERVQELGGSLSLESSRGTRLQIELPQSSENAKVPLEVLEP
jgi:two-component system, NarL family, sensor histidine kinase DesK